MNASRMVAWALFACNSGSATTQPQPSDLATGVPPTNLRASTAAELRGLDKDAVLGKLTGSRAAMASLKRDCQLLYSDPPAENLGSLVKTQHHQASAWEATCRARDDHHSDCIVTLTNDVSADEEFMARYSFELDENGILVDSSVGCDFAG